MSDLYQDIHEASARALDEQPATIPRAQLEAYRAAVKALNRSREWAWSEFEGSIDQFEGHPEVKAIDGALAALRAAGIEP